MVMPARRDFLGSRLLDLGLVSEAQLDLALKEKVRTGETLPRVLRHLRFMTEETVAQALANILDLPLVSLGERRVEPRLLEGIDKPFAIRHLFFPLELRDGALFLAMADPCDVEATDSIQQRVGLPLLVGVATESDIRAAVERHFGGAAESGGRMEDVIRRAVQHARESNGSKAAAGEDGEVGAPVIELTDMVILQGVREGATDIHFEPEEKLLRMRYRIDGILQPGPTLPKELQASLLSRLKIMSDLNISEKRLPQDGRMRLVTEGRQIDVRVSVLPTVFGENVVLRILEKNAVLFDLDNLGFPGEIREELRRIAGASYGIFLVTGPTGSGKSTTLYSTLASVNSMEKKVVTVEDPVEYQVPLIRQCQINSKIGFTFAEGLRSILRQDPDIIMVGEIRDLETLHIAIHAGLTGHLVLSTLHTNSAIGAFPRMVDMGLEPYLVTSSILGVLAQRLLRRVCSQCQAPAEATEEERTFLEAHGKPGVTTVTRGRGCPRCRGTGYKGRLGIYELFRPDEACHELILRKAPEDEMIRTARARGMKFLVDDGVDKVLRGLTTVAEVIRVT